MPTIISTGPKKQQAMAINNLFDLSGKTALVTGCDKGIGLAMATALAAAGANIIGTSATGGYEPARQAVEAVGRQFSYYQVDFANREALYTFIAAVQQAHPVVDILVNNAGTILRQAATDHSDEYWDRVMAVNLDAQFILTREFGKTMLRQGQGKIIFTCSLLSFQGGINVPGYTASKSAIAGLVKAFANEWAAQGICVNGIAPGYVVTNNTDALRNDPDRSASILARIPAGRWGQPDDFKGPAVFLASPASDYVNGTILVVDGGWMGR
jgi:2-dehydro-3-deoxy-D-gluconate 5-dehydrogenase